MPQIYRLALLSLGLILSACASQPDRKGPPDRPEGAERPARTSGVFMPPVAIFLGGMDVNADKVISRAEMTTGTSHEWARFDRNPSAINFAQWSIANLGSTDAAPTFLSFDQDFNGVITEIEFTEQMDEEFDRLDKNKDGQLTRAEMVIAVDAPMGQNRQRGGDSGGGRGERGQGGGRPPR